MSLSVTLYSLAPPYHLTYSMEEITMSQGFQQIKEHITIRNEGFLEKASSADPVIHEHCLYPVGEVCVQSDTADFHGWSTVSARTIENIEETVWYGGDEFILDLGTHCVGYFGFKCKVIGSPQDAPVHLQFIFGEIAAEVGEDFSDYNGWLSSSWLQKEDKYYDVMPSDVRLERRYCARYIKIRIVATSRKFGVKFSNLHFNCVSSVAADITVRPFTFSDPLLERINSVSILTLKNCMQSVFEDGPKRDRRLWLGDLRLQALVNYATFRQNDLVKRCLYLFASVTRQDGMVSANLFMKPVVQADDTYLLDYSLFFVATLADYYRETGDGTTLAELWPTALNQLKLAMNRLDARGLLIDSEEWWAFIDWHESLNKQAAAQGVFIYCVKKGIELAEVIEPGRLMELKALENHLSTAVREHLWDQRSGFFTSGKEKQVSWASQVWLVLAGIGDQVFQAELLERLQASSTEVRLQTPYMMHHYAEALIQCGKKEMALNLIKSYWGQMAEHGADTFWEVFDPDNASLSPYGNPLINSYCHAWSCTPAWLLRQ